MKVWGKIHQNNKIIASAVAQSDNADPSEALLICLEKIYKELNLSEPVWITKHAKELSHFNRTRFLPDDFLETVDFDFFEIEFIMK